MPLSILCITLYINKQTICANIYYNLPNIGPYTIVCLHGSLTHAWVQVFIEVFRFAIERVIYRNMGESRSTLRWTRRHVWKTRLGAVGGANGTTRAQLPVVGTS